MTSPAVQIADDETPFVPLGVLYGDAQPDPQYAAVDGLVGWGMRVPVSGARYPMMYGPTLAGSWGTEVSAPAGPQGDTGVAGALASSYPTSGTAVAAGNSFVQRRTAWRATTSYTAGASFEADVLGGKLEPLNVTGGIETFNPYLCRAYFSQATTGPTAKTVFQRMHGAGPVTKLLIDVGNASGNVAVGVYRARGSAGSGPGVRAFLSTPTAAVAGVMTFAVPSGLVKYIDDYAAVFSDDPTCTFACSGAFQDGTYSALYDGDTYFSQATSAPTDATSLSPAPSRGVLVVGRP